ncbi:Ubiquitin-conjugating enzyme E2 2 [Fusarium oxysporum f. sp. albedinis]|nr:Ubiquitin-conjugating enzyme E2 2 [Fusarium oxysporum f. sp. albedinis]
MRACGPTVHTYLPNWDQRTKANEILPHLSCGIPVELSLFSTLSGTTCLSLADGFLFTNKIYRIRSTPEFQGGSFLYLDRGKKTHFGGGWGAYSSEVQLERAADWLTIKRLLLLGLSCQA